jgi:benzodiazapine receptor
MESTESQATSSRSSWKDATALAAFGAATGAIAALSAGGMREGPRSAWYRALRKPAFQPPREVFAPVWAGLYASIAYSGYRTFRASPSRRRTVALGLWAAQLALNGAWSPLFFGKKQARAALADSTLLLGTAAGYATTAARVDRRAAWSFAPYVGWLAFATLLNLEIIRRNRRQSWF